jgi:AcrR family transcriptional regulator
MTTRPGGRSARVRTSVLEAVESILATDGYAELSIEAVADRAGVHKTTVYRRWATREALVADAVRERSRVAVPVPDTGSLRGDLTALGRAVAANVGSPAGTRLARTLLAAGVTDADVAQDQRAFWDERLRLCEPIVARAITRGEIAQKTDPRFVIESLIGPLYVRLLLTGEPVTKRIAEQSAALVADALGA